MNLQLKHVYAQLEKKRLDGLIISSQPNISYLTKFSSRDAYLLLSPKANIYFTDSRYIEEAKIGLKGSAEIKKINGSFYKIIADACKNLGLKHVGFEERNLTYAEYKKIKENLNRDMALVPTYNLVEGLRQIKSNEEIEKIRKATRITIRAFEFIKNFILPGKKEIEVAAELERFIRYNGASKSSFEIIVASGPNSSYPHHITSQRKIKNNELVLIDIGVEYLGYKSDLTRIFFLGKMNILTREIYEVVLKAQSLAINKIKANVFIAGVDATARQYIADKGYGSFFGHNLGHGVGLEVHEAPSISAKENSKLKVGMVFTIEPAIYLPNKFGIRLEDMITVTPQGCEVLSGSLHK